MVLHMAGSPHARALVKERRLAPWPYDYVSLDPLDEDLCRVFSRSCGPKAARFHSPARPVVKVTRARAGSRGARTVRYCLEHVPKRVIELWTSVALTLCGRWVT